MTEVETARKILEQGNCGGCSCNNCPAFTNDGKKTGCHVEAIGCFSLRHKSREFFESWLKEHDVKTCKWEHQVDSFYANKCVKGNRYVWTYSSDFTYCPFCCKPIELVETKPEPKIVPWSLDDDLLGIKIIAINGYKTMITGQNERCVYVGSGSYTYQELLVQCKQYPSGESCGKVES